MNSVLISDLVLKGDRFWQKSLCRIILIKREIQSSDMWLTLCHENQWKLLVLFSGK